VKSRRAMVGGAIIVAWLGGLALLVRREYFRPQIERLAEAAMRVAPGAVYYGVMQGDRQVGFASSTLDTTATSIGVTDYLVADVPVGGQSRRATARTTVTLSRAFRLVKFDLAIDAEGSPVRAGGRVDGDSVLILGVGTRQGENVDSQRVALTGPILLPTLVPLAVSLTERPKLGKHYVFPVLDPSTMSSRDIGLDVRAESLFVVNDSSVFDPTTRKWHAVQPDTVRAWQIVAQTAGGFSGWIDEQGRIVATTQLGFDLRRLPYEVAFENWRSDTGHVAMSDGRDIIETTAIAANARMAAHISALELKLSGANLSGLDINGPYQRLAADTLMVSEVPDSAMATKRRLPYKSADASGSDPEPLLQSNDRQIVQLARRLRGPERDPRVVAERINTWVHDSIADRITFGVPNALQVLKTRSGDCNEHTQLFVALARAAGLPARVAAGLAYVDGKFYYHAWPEVFLDNWVPVDPTFGQFPADAAHLRFTVGGLARQTELLRLMGNLRIDVLSVNGSAARRASRGGK
jgi:Transglutaminase-like superfamily